VPFHHTRRATTTKYLMQKVSSKNAYLWVRKSGLVGQRSPLSRLFSISIVYFPNARSIFLLKCSLRSLMESMSFSSWCLRRG